MFCFFFCIQDSSSIGAIAGGAIGGALGLAALIAGGKQLYDKFKGFDNRSSPFTISYVSIFCLEVPVPNQVQVVVVVVVTRPLSRYVS